MLHGILCVMIETSSAQTLEQTLKKEKQQNGVQRFFKLLGPGIITGAADDDPSGIATYSQTGAQFGFGQLWTSLYLLPVLFFIQEACGRIGAVTGKGLARIIKDHYTKKVLYAMVFLVVVANTINIGADIGAIAAAGQLLFPHVHFAVFAIGAASIIMLLEVFITYKKYARVLKWLAITLLAYPLTALIISQPWKEIFHATIIPHIQWNFEFLFLITGVFGTTISPYMFFWQTSEEVEEKKISTEKETIAKRLQGIRIDTAIGMVASNIAQWFIIITAATVLFKNGITNITTAADAAQALEPLVHSFPHAGLLAKIIFAIGIVGLGFLAIPVLAGSAGYALADTFGWKQGLSKTFSQAKAFYGVIIAATIVGLLLNFIGIDPIKALVFTAVFNGIAAIPLLYLIGRINSSEAILGHHKGSITSRCFIWIGFIIMTLAGIGIFWSAGHMLFA